MNFLNDPRLPHLPIASDPRVMTAVFAEKLRPTLDALGWQVETCTIESVQPQQGRQCLLLYRVIMREAAGKEIDQWFWGRLFRPGHAQRKFEMAQAHRFVQSSAWQPVYFWPDLEMVLWSFPHDPEMPGLTKAANQILVREQVDANLPAWGLSREWRCEEVTFNRIEYQPGKRCVLGCSASLVHDSRERRNLSFHSKTHGRGVGCLHYPVLQRLYDHLDRALNIPRPLANWSEADTFWQSAWEGRPFMDMLVGLEWEMLFPRVANFLAAFHKSLCPDLPIRNDLDEIGEAAQQDAHKILWHAPQYRPRLSKAMADLTQGEEFVAKQPTKMVPVLGSTQIEQIVIREDEVAIKDFGEVGLGDPLRDVAEFLVSLRYLEYSHGFSPDRVEKAAELFIDGYQKQVPWELKPQILAWYAGAFLTTKIHVSFLHSDSNVLHKLESVFELMETWLKMVKGRSP